ncbi:cobalt transport protein [Desulfatibacillum aliphaticivorans]|uniref:Cobalt transport protein n=1 Tax=Desulfatibacillum aliphaticivorans TaxID=218208 RepID=B8FH00_DESAL|nr:energy-coupling factor transporter transmembrane component T [Desulfatibacillum aliphaticivorans]ACL02088.1 cobalt transport protein [Desulfatibacillum aliphaticivorans]
MAGVNLFVYTPGATAVHRMDPRFKLAALVVLSLATVQCGPYAALGLFFIAAFTAIAGKVPAFTMIRNAQVFLLFLVGIILVRGAVTPGPAVFNGAIPWFSVNGLEDGLLISWRLFVVLIASAVFTGATRTSGVFSAVRWYFKPIPFMDGARAAMMLTLMMRFIPIILEEADSIKEAQRSRGLENRKNPVYRITRLVPPLMERTFTRAQDLTLALVSRNFGPNPTSRGLHAQKTDWLYFLLFFSLCAGLRVLD